MEALGLALAGVVGEIVDETIRARKEPPMPPWRGSAETAESASSTSQMCGPTPGSRGQVHPAVRTKLPHHHADRCAFRRRRRSVPPFGRAYPRRSPPAGLRSTSYSGRCQTEMWLRLVLVKASRFQPLHRSRKAIPARRAMRSNSDGHTLRNGAEKDLVWPSTNQ
jgi:hypothetical protein